MEQLDQSREPLQKLRAELEMGKDAQQQLQKLTAEAKKKWAGHIEMSKKIKLRKIRVPDPRRHSCSTHAGSCHARSGDALALQ